MLPFLVYTLSLHFERRVLIEVYRPYANLFIRVALPKYAT